MYFTKLAILHNVGCIALCKKEKLNASPNWVSSPPYYTILYIDSLIPHVFCHNCTKYDLHQPNKLG